MTTVDLPASFQETLLAHLPYADGTSLSAQDELPALGLDSIGVIQLLGAIEEKYQLDFPDEVLNEETFATAGSLWAAVCALIPAAPHGNE